MTQVRAAQITELPPASEIGPFADWVLLHGESIQVGGFLLVPDILLAEWVANETDLPETVTIARDDGRTVSVFAVVGTTGYPLTADES